MAQVTDMSAYLYQPREVSIETLALCNARCTFCPYPTLERKGEKLPDNTILKMLDEMANWKEPFYISPFKVNEPLLDPRLPGICEDIQWKCDKAKIRLFTNGSALTDKHINWIARLHRIDHLWISLNEIDPDKYRDVMGINLYPTLGRIDNLHARRVARTFLHPVVISRVSNQTPEHAAVNGPYSADDCEFLKYVFNRWPHFQGRIIKRDGWLGFVDPSSSDIPQSPCARWWEMSICADGKAALCCMDGTGEFSIGNVYENSLLDIYNQPHLIKRRQHAIDRRGIDPCQRCTY